MTHRMLSCGKHLSYGQLTPIQHPMMVRAESNDIVWPFIAPVHPWVDVTGINVIPPTDYTGFIYEFACDSSCSTGCERLGITLDVVFRDGQICAQPRAESLYRSSFRDASKWFTTALAVFRLCQGFAPKCLGTVARAKVMLCHVGRLCSGKKLSAAQAGFGFIRLCLRARQRTETLIEGGAVRKEPSACGALSSQRHGPPPRLFYHTMTVGA